MKPTTRLLGRARAAVGLAVLAALVVMIGAPASAPAKKKGRSACAPAAAAALRPSPVKKHRRGRAKTRALAARACLRSGRLVGVSGAARAGAPASFGVGRPFAGAPVAAPAPGTTPSPTATPTPTPTGPSLPTIPTNPRALQVQAFEFGLQLSKASVLSGGVRVEFNSSRAEDPHNLVLVRSDGTGNIYEFGEQPAGAVSSKTLQLSAGRWKLFCSLPRHESLGMTATLTVDDE